MVAEEKNLDLPQQNLSELGVSERALDKIASQDIGIKRRNEGPAASPDMVNFRSE